MGEALKEASKPAPCLADWAPIREAIASSQQAGEVGVDLSGIDWLYHTKLDFVDYGTSHTLGLNQTANVLRESALPVLKEIVDSSRSGSVDMQRVNEIKRGIVRTLSCRVPFWDRCRFLKSDDEAHTLAELRMLSLILGLSHHNHARVIGDLMFLLLQPVGIVLMPHELHGAHSVGFLRSLEGNIMFSCAFLAAPFSNDADARRVIETADPDMWFRNSLHAPWPVDVQECLCKLRRRFLFGNCVGQLRMAVYMPNMPLEYQLRPLRRLDHDDILVTLDSSTSHHLFQQGFLDKLSEMYSVHRNVVNGNTDQSGATKATETL